MSNDIFAKVVVDELVVNASPAEYKVSAIINDPVSKVTINKDSSVAVFRYVSTNPPSFFQKNYHLVKVQSFPLHHLYFYKNF